MLDRCLAQIVQGRDLSREQAGNAARMMFGDNLDNTTIAEFLVALAEKGESATEIAAFASVLLENTVSFASPQGAVDLCGTGGSGYSRFNVSTAAAFVAAACGVPIIKHGNKGSRQPNGSFDLLEALGLPIEVPPEIAQEALEKTGLAFLYARQYHPIMKHVAPARKLANRRTIFNLIGPLSNPANIDFQVIGTADPARVQVLAEALKLLGRKRALVVTGEPGIDELSVSGISKLLDVTATEITDFSVLPETVGIERVNYEEIPSGQAPYNAGLFHELLENAGPASLKSMVALNTGAVLYVAGRVRSIPEGCKQANAAMVDGRMKAVFETYRDFMLNAC
jgi:anthranilate phosphoribosyltransferase